jgi:hypothetical protein
MITLAAPPHEEAGGSVAAFIPRKPSGYQTLVLGKKLRETLILGFQHLGHTRISFNIVVREILTLGEGFNTQDVTQSFNMVVREILTLGEGFKVSTLRSLPYRLQARMA